jgi:hypothetical protein
VGALNAIIPQWGRRGRAGGRAGGYDPNAALIADCNISYVVALKHKPANQSSGKSAETSGPNLTMKANFFCADGTRQNLNRFS